MSHREHKKQQTRLALIASAHALFAEKGYEATTLAEITAAANCAPRTFFEYFNSKEDLLLVGADRLIGSLAEALAQRPKGTNTIRAFCQWAYDASRKIPAADPQVVALNKKISTVPSAAQTRRIAYLTQRLRAVLAPELAKDFNADLSSPKVKLMAAAVAAAFDLYHTDPAMTKLGLVEFISRTELFLNGVFKILQDT
jgi:AcrR family transcriptional regulator